MSSGVSNNANGGEFSRMFDVRQCEGRAVELTASDSERVALAVRFDLITVNRLAAVINLTRSGLDIDAKGTLTASIVQSCAISGEDLPVEIDEPVEVRFAFEESDQVLPLELELEADDCDTIPYSGSTFDLGEAIAQSLALAIDPFATGPQADEARRRAGLVPAENAGPFAALAALKK